MSLELAKFACVGQHSLWTKSLRPMMRSGLGVEQTMKSSELGLAMKAVVIEAGQTMKKHNLGQAMMEVEQEPKSQTDQKPSRVAEAQTAGKVCIVAGEDRGVVVVEGGRQTAE